MPYQFTQTGAEIQDILDTVDDLNSGYASGTQDTTISSGSWQVAYSTTNSYDPGVYLIEYGGAFASDNTGVRMLGLSTSNSSYSANRWSPSLNAVSSQATRFVIARIYSITAASHFYIWAYQNSGSSLGFQGFLRIVRLR